MKIIHIPLLMLILAAESFSQPGTLDPSFGQNGIVTNEFNVTGTSIINSVAVQSDGKIVAAGNCNISTEDDFLAVRYNPDGSLDNTFGLNGIVIIPVGEGIDMANSAAIQSDGKIIVGGLSYAGAASDFSLVRINADGSLDETFGTGGKIITSIGASFDGIKSIAIQSNGKIVAAGYSIDGDYKFALARYNSNGILDPLFGTGGIVVIPSTSTDYIESVSIQSDGKIIAAGRSNFLGSQDFALARFNTDGTLDNTFGINGLVITISGSSEDMIYSTAIQPDGKIIAAGYSNLGGTNDFTMVRYNSNGTLDNSFGLNGVVITVSGATEDAAYQVSLQSDGKIVLTGSTAVLGQDAFATARYNQDGSIDNTFGINGVVLTQIIVLGQQATSGLIQSDGKIIAAGHAENDNALIRYTPEGTLDNSFGKEGIVLHPAGNSDNEAISAKLQSDGKIVVGGFTSNGFNYDFALLRFNDNGGLDTTFGTGGTVTTPIGTSDDQALSIAIQSDNKIVAAGSSDNGINTDFALARFNSNGTLDNTFGTAGIITTTIGSADEAAAVIIQSDGKIIAAGYTYVAADADFALVRYNTDGGQDNTFGTDGVVITPLGPANDKIYSVAIQGDGKILAAGSSVTGADQQFALARYNEDGTLDNSFGVNGIVKTNIGSTSVIRSIVIRPDNKIIAGGYSHDGTYYNFTLACYNLDGTLDNSFGVNGIVITNIGASYSEILSIAVQSNGKIVAAGFYQTGLTLARYDQNGIIDPSFGTGGIATTQIGLSFSTAYSALIQNDGKIVAAGCASFSAAPILRCAVTLVRYNGDPPVDVEDNTNINPSAFSLEQNFPNPFNPSTILRFSIPATAVVSLRVFDVLGKEAAVLLNEQKAAGTYDISFNAGNLSAGVYFYRLQTENFIDTKKFLLIK